MMRKEIILSLLFIGSSLGARADLTIELTPGSAAQHADELRLVSGTLKVTGEVDARDFATLNSLPESVTCLDMREMRIASRSTAQPDAMGMRVHQESRIPPYAFFKCTVAEVVFPDGCSLGEGVMACAATNKVTLPEGLKEIPDYAFYNSSVASLDAADDVVKVGKYAFFGARLEVVSLPAIRIGGDYAMSSMPQLKEVTLNPAASLGLGFLMDCPLLAKVNDAPGKMPDYFAADSRRLNAERLAAGATEVGDYAVANARNSAIVLSSGLRHIGEGAFSGMTRLSMIEANACGADVPEAAESAFYGVDPADVTLYVASGTRSAWAADPVWSRFNIVEGRSSVDAVSSDSGGIIFAFDGSVLYISSPEILASMEVYEPSGTLLKRETPGSESVRIDLGAYAASKIVIVKAVNQKGESSVKLAL